MRQNQIIPVGRGFGLAVKGTKKVVAIYKDYKIAKKSAEEANAKVVATKPVGSKYNQMNQPANPAYQPVRNSSGSVNGRKYTGHALDRMQDRGIIPSAVEDAIKNGSKTNGLNSTTNYYSPINKITVVTNKKGDVVTVSHGKINGKAK